MHVKIEHEGKSKARLRQKLSLDRLDDWALQAL